MALLSKDTRHRTRKQVLKAREREFPADDLLDLLLQCASEHGNVRLPLAANLAGIIVNTSLNYVLIFGKLGRLPWVMQDGIRHGHCPFHGVSHHMGAVYASRSVVSIRLKDLFGISADLFRKFFRHRRAHRKRRDMGFGNFHLYGEYMH